MASSIITGLNNYDVESVAKKITNYSLFAGGLDMTNAASEIYTPLVGGYGRLFMVRQPKFLVDDTQGAGYNNEMKIFKHILEYGNTGVSGIGDITMEVETMTGGYTGTSVEMATVSKSDTTAFTVKVYEFAGSPVRNLLHLWITGIADPLTGLATYHGSTLPVNQANHTAEFIYLVTDRSGNEVEYACMLANCIPKKVPVSHFDYDAGSHQLVQLDIEFSCVKYESLAINTYARRLLNAFKILGNHLNFNPGLQDATGVTGVRSNLLGGLDDTSITAANKVDATMLAPETKAKGSYTAKTYDPNENKFAT